MAQEVISFSFGRNWKNYSRLVSQTSIELAAKSLRRLFHKSQFSGLTFLDIGCGSGLFSLAARSLNAAKVVSIDYCSHSVECTQSLIQKFKGVGSEENENVVVQASVLDTKKMHSLGQFDLVYSWGVLHHTGNMWKAIENAACCTKGGGLFSIAIYNECGLAPFWLKVKRAYNKSPAVIKWLMNVGLYSVVLLAKLGKGQNPFRRNERAMTAWYDVVDWLGGLPYEWASQEAIISFVTQLGFSLEGIWPVQGFSHGCNEFTFRRHV